MKDHQVSDFNLEAFISELQTEIAKNKLMIVTTQPASTGKWGMTKLWRSWMATTAKYMAENGAKMPLFYKPDGTPYGLRAFNANDAHELFTFHHLGADENGNRLSWSKSGNDTGRAATKGERFNALRKHENWCVEKGIRLFKPRNSEYEKLIEEEHQC